MLLFQSSLVTVSGWKVSYLTRSSWKESQPVQVASAITANRVFRS